MLNHFNPFWVNWLLFSISSFSSIVWTPDLDGLPYKLSILLLFKIPSVYNTLSTCSTFWNRLLSFFWSSYNSPFLCKSRGFRWISVNFIVYSILQVICTITIFVNRRYTNSWASKTVSWEEPPLHSGSFKGRNIPSRL